MATTVEQADGQVANGGKSSTIVLIISAVCCVLGGAVGYYSVFSGLIPLPLSEKAETYTRSKAEALPDIAFVEIPTLIITLPPDAKNKHLRFTGQIEVPREYKEDVEFLMPRIQDLMNGYLRALRAKDIEGGGAIFRIRLHLYRRILMVVGLNRANSLLITEFVLR